VLPVLVAGITSLLSAFLGLLDGDYQYSLLLGEWGLGFLAAGLTWLAVTRPTHSLTKEGALVLVALAWVLVPLLSAIPVAAVMKLPFVDVWFESVSGFTTTGLSVFTGGVDPAYGVYLPSVEELPWSVNAWRASTQWLGGFGVVVVFYAFARLAGLPAHLVGFAEGRFERLEPSIARSIRALMKLYVLITLAAFAAIYAAGMPPSDALFHAMAAVSTGGFSTHSQNVGYYHDPLVWAATVAAMTVGALNFADLYALFSMKPRRASIEEKTLAVIYSLSAPAAVAALVAAGVVLAKAVPWALYDVASAVTTTGFGIHDLGATSDLYKLILVALMMIGGSAFSTAGGLKLYRAAVIASTLKWGWARTLKGKDYIQAYRVGGETIDFEELARVVEVAALFILAAIVGAAVLLVAIPGLKLADALFEATSAVCTTGLSVGVTSASTPLPAKLALLALMDLGRLEIHVYIAAAAAAVEALRSRPHRQRETRHP
jgi:trk system potassium uptake protein TrkH